MKMNTQTSYSILVIATLFLGITVFYQPFNFSSDDKLSITQYAAVSPTLSNQTSILSKSYNQTTTNQTSASSNNQTQISGTSNTIISQPIRYPATQSLVPSIMFDDIVYRLGDSAHIYLKYDDPFYEQLGKIPARVYSTSDPMGMKIGLVETPQKGVFVGEINLISGPSSKFPPFNNLHVNYFDKINVMAYLGLTNSTIASTNARISDYQMHADLTIDDVKLMRSATMTKLYNSISALNAGNFINSTNATSAQNIMKNDAKAAIQTTLNNQYYGTYTYLTKIGLESKMWLTHDGQSKILPLVNNLLISLKIDTMPDNATTFTNYDITCNNPNSPCIPEFPYFIPLVIGIAAVIILQLRTGRIKVGLWHC